MSAMDTETPIFAAVLDEWLDTHDNRPPGDFPDAAPVKSAMVSTPLMDDVEANGTGPWDEKRRANFTAPPSMPRPRAPRKSAKPRTPRGKR